MPRKRKAPPLTSEWITLRRGRRRVGTPPPLISSPLPLKPPQAPRFEVSLHRSQHLRRLVAEQLRRRHEALRIYEPLPVQDDFHKSLVKQRILRGSNRGGKTLPAAVEVARAVTGQDPSGKFPQRGGRAYLVGRDLKHVAEVMWHKLYRPGAFQMIKDCQSGRWRAFRPWDPADASRAAEARKAPPLIPHRMIKSIAWENKAKCIPSKVTLKNGWEIDFFSSDGKPRRGVDIDLWWIDEELTREEWHSELVARVLDRKGRGLWSATPQTGNDALLLLSERAAEEAVEPEPAVEEFVVLLMDNPHVPAAEKTEFIKSLNEQDIDVRIHGEFAQTSRKVFPEWEPSLHKVPFFQVPAHYTIYAFVDPGRQCCAVLFAAVPPPLAESDPMAGPYVYLFDELYIKNCTADTFGQKMRQKCQGRQMEAFVIDSHGARIVDIGGGRSVEAQYSQALRDNKVKSRRTGSGFFPSSDNVDGGIEACRGLLRLREGLGPKLRVLCDAVPNFEKEIRRYRNQVVGGMVTDKPEQRGPVHQMANFRYMAMFDPRHRLVTLDASKRNPALRAFQEKQGRLKRRKGQSRVLLGPGEWNERGG